MNNSNIYRGSPIQRGYGLGGTFKKFFNWLVPLVEKYALPTIKDIGKQALSTAADITKDVVSGKNIKNASTERINTGVDNLKTYFENKLEGKGIKRKKKKNLIFKNKYNDFFYTK